MSVSMIVVDSDSLLVERKEGADCVIFLPARPATSAPENVAPEPLDAVPEDETDTGEESTPEESKPHALAIAAFNSGGVLTPKHVIYWLIHNDVTDIDTGLMVDICDDLMISDMTAVCLMSDNSGFMVHHVKKTSSGDWECRTVKGEVSKYAVVTSDGSFHICDRFMETKTPDQNAILSYATYARHNDALSNNFDQYVAMIDEIIENAHI